VARVRVTRRCDRDRYLDYEKLVREAHTRKVIALLIGHILLSRSVTWTEEDP